MYIQNSLSFITLSNKSKYNIQMYYTFVYFKAIEAQKVTSFPFQKFQYFLWQTFSIGIATKQNLRQLKKPTTVYVDDTFMRQPLQNRIYHRIQFTRENEYISKLLFLDVLVNRTYSYILGHGIKRKPNQTDRTSSIFTLRL